MPEVINIDMMNIDHRSSSEIAIKGTISEPFDIYSKAQECKDLFATHLEKPSSYDEQVSMCQRRFLEWAGFLGVFAMDSVSLDRRLEFHPEVKNLVMSMLQVLKRNLERSLNRKTLVKSPHTNSEIAEDDGIIYGVAGAIDRLHRLAIAIRHSPRTDEVERVHNFASKQAPDGFNGVVTAMIQFFFPEAETSLKTQLAESIVYRRHRMLWNRRHSQKLAYQRKLNSDIQHTSEKIAASGEDKPFRQELMVRGSRQQTSSTVIAGTTYSSTRPSLRPLIQNKMLRKIQQESQNEDSRSARSFNPPPTAQYPRFPGVAMGETKILCQYCLREVEIPLKATEKEKENIWKNHLVTDLRPYVCVSEECRNIPTAFSSSKEWKTHMNNNHGNEWARYIHRVKWLCPFCSDNETCFSSEDLLGIHLNQAQWESHPPVLNAFDHAKKKLEGRMTDPREAKHCPLCGPPPWNKPGRIGNVNENNDSSAGPVDIDMHFLGHLHHLALFSISWWDADIGAIADASQSNHSSANTNGLNSQLDEHYWDECNDDPLWLDDNSFEKLLKIQAERESIGQKYQRELTVQQTTLYEQLQARLDGATLKRCQELREKVKENDPTLHKDLSVILDELDELHERLRVEAEAVMPLDTRLERIGKDDAEPPDSNPAVVIGMWLEVEARFKKDKSQGPETDRILQNFIQSQTQLHDVSSLSLFEKVNEKELEELMTFISSEMFGKSHDIVTHTRVENTGDWLLANQDFRTWQDAASSSAVFLLKGAGGTGKTYLTSRVIDHVKSNLKKSPHDEGFAFFYCNRSGSSMQQPIVVLRSFVRQLSGKAFDDSDEIQSSLVQKCAEAKKNGRELSYKDCEELILKSFDAYSKTTIILDALDESDIGAYNLAKALIRIAEESRRPVKVFISSRPDREYLEEVMKDKFLITVDAGNQHDDIQKYLEDKLYSTESFKRRKQEIQDEIKGIFDTKGSGMFQWVYLKVKSLERCVTDDAVYNWTQKLPRDLIEAYNQQWKSIQERDESNIALAERAIQWVLCSIKPLKSEELLEAIRYTIEGSTVVEKGQQSQQEILSLCQGFLTIDEKRGVWMLPHASVAEYFEARGWTGWKCDAFAAKICLGFLDKFQPNEIIYGTFADYVDNRWHEHVKRYDDWLGLEKEGEADPSVAAALKRFLGSPNESSDSYRKWVSRYTYMEPADMALFAMCRFGFYHTLRDWWLEGKITQEMALQKNKWDDNSLAMAAEGGWMPICRHLAGLIDATHADAGRHARALVSALEGENDDILKMLVMEANADVNFTDRQQWTAAQYAAARRPEMLQWMVGQGLVDLEKENESGFEYGNVLIAAAGEGNVESVRILLGAGANVNAAVRYGNYGSALVAVAANCETDSHVEIAKLLLDSGAEPNLPLTGGRYGSALEAVAHTPRYWGVESRRKLQHMLLEAGADPTAVSDRGEHGSAMAAAAFNGQKDLLKAMVDRVGADKAIDVLCQSRHPDIRRFKDQADVERWKDTAAYLANEVGASKDVLRGIGLWDVEPVRTGLRDELEIRFAELRKERNTSTFGSASDGSN